MQLPFEDNYINNFFPKDVDGAQHAELVYYFSFYFPNGYKKLQRQQAVNVAKEFWDLCGHEFQWMTNPKTHNWRKIPKGYTLDKWLSSFPEADWVWQMVFHSGNIKNEAARYQINGLGNSTETFSMSSLTLSVPFNWFADKSPQAHPIMLFKRWAEMLQPVFGTSGLGILPPNSLIRRGKTDKLVSQLSAMLPGLEICDSFNSNSVLNGILSPNWLTLISNEDIEKLGGINHLTQSLTDLSVVLYPYKGGVLISASQEPLLCHNGELNTVPVSYRNISNSLKALRTDKPYGFWGVHVSKSLDWYARLD